MKSFSVFIVLVAMAFASATCKKDPLSKLPTETQTGANTFGCLIDGVVWQPGGSDGYSGQNKVAYYQFVYPSSKGYVFNISATNYERNPLETFVLGVDSSNIAQGVVYELRNGYKGEFGASYRIGITGESACWVWGDLDGEIYFTKFDDLNQVASGTFWFDAMNASGKVIHVTKGRFDMKFTR
jgi:hypothetical protein